MPKSERAAKRKQKLVGGGFRITRSAGKKDSGKGGSMKASRRQLRKAEKAKRKRNR